jgi:hypothetical protein
MKKVLLSIVGVIAVLAVAGTVFRGHLINYFKDDITRNMFIAGDTDSFDPGLAIGDTFPLLHASYRGEVISDMGQFINDKGMIFIANRSADW